MRARSGAPQRYSLMLMWPTRSASSLVLSYDSGGMGTPPTPPNPVQPAVLDQQPPPVSTRSDAEMHFTNLLGYFKHLVWITTAAVTVILGAAVYFLASNLRDVRQDAREQATRVATEESKTAVRKTFDEKNINDLIHKAAIDK